MVSQGDTQTADSERRAASGQNHTGANAVEDYEALLPWNVKLTEHR